MCIRDSAKTWGTRQVIIKAEDADYDTQTKKHKEWHEAPREGRASSNFTPIGSPEFLEVDEDTGRCNMCGQEFTGRSKKKLESKDAAAPLASEDPDQDDYKPKYNSAEEALKDPNSTFSRMGRAAREYASSANDTKPESPNPRKLTKFDTESPQLKQLQETKRRHKLEELEAEKEAQENEPSDYRDDRD